MVGWEIALEQMLSSVCDNAPLNDRTWLNLKLSKGEGGEKTPLMILTVLKLFTEVILLAPVQELCCVHI